MSLIAIGMNLLLAGLLAAAMVVGIRLNGRLKALRDSHDGFEAAVRELNVAASRAEQGLADLRAATDEATEMLSDRIEKGRALAARLERLTVATPTPAAVRVEPPRPRAMPPVMPSRTPMVEDTAEQRLSALLAAARVARALPETLVADEPVVGRAPLHGHRVALDDDLFEDAPLVLGRSAGSRW